MSSFWIETIDKASIHSLHLDIIIIIIIIIIVVTIMAIFTAPIRRTKFNMKREGERVNNIHIVNVSVHVWLYVHSDV